MILTPSQNLDLVPFSSLERYFEQIKEFFTEGHPAFFVKAKSYEADPFCRVVQAGRIRRGGKLSSLDTHYTSCCSCMIFINTSVSWSGFFQFIVTNESITDEQAI